MKIGFTGTMSVGKTTLVNALKDRAEFKDYTFTTERSKYLRDLGIPLNTDSTLKGQVIFLAERCSELLQENIITDRTVVDVMAFTNLSKSMNPSESYAYYCLASKLIGDYDYIFYISPEGVDMEDNGVRETDVDYRADINTEIKSILSVIKNLVKLKGNTEDRVEKVISTIFPNIY